MHIRSAAIALAIPALALAIVFGSPASADPATPVPPAPAEGSDESQAEATLTLTGDEHIPAGKRAKLTLEITVPESSDFGGQVTVPAGLSLSHVNAPNFWVGYELGNGTTFTFKTASEATKGALTFEVSAKDGTARDGVVTATLLKPALTVEKKLAVDGADTITGAVWHDQNRDGRYTHGEPGVPAVAVLLLNVGDRKAPPVQSTKTGTDGRFSFANQPLDEYVLVVLTPGKGWAFTEANVGNDVGDSDVKAVGDGQATSTEFTLDGTKDVVLEAGLVTVAPSDSPSPTASASQTASPSPSASVTPTASVTPSSGTPTVSPTVAPPGGGSLPRTGAALTGAITAGVLLLGGGIALTVLARRRRAAL